MKKIYFTKMHGIGNDYVYVDCTVQNLEKPECFSIFISDRHFGIGSDGLVLILPSDVADFRMRMFNADGSEGMMCGNATRCVGKYVYERGLTQKTELTLETKSGIKHLKLTVEDQKVVSVEVDMGVPILLPKEIPVKSELERFVNQPIEVNGQNYNITCVSMGNPHAILYLEEIDGLNLEKIGPWFENHPLFPERINTEFVRIIDRNTLQMRVWERGSGETLACGTGACAVAVSSVLNHFCRQDEELTLRLRGGELKITWLSSGTVIMKGPATDVFDGAIAWEG